MPLMAVKGQVGHRLGLSGVIGTGVPGFTSLSPATAAVGWLY